MKNSKFYVVMVMFLAIALMAATVAMAAPKADKKVQEQAAPTAEQKSFDWEGQSAQQTQPYSTKGLAAVGQGSTKVTITVEGGKAKVNFANIYGNPSMRGVYTPDKWIRGTTLLVFAGGPDAAGNAKIAEVPIVDNAATVVIDNPADAVKANPTEYGIKAGQSFKAREHFWAMVKGPSGQGSIILDPNDPAVVFYTKGGNTNLDTLVIQADFYSDGTVKVGKASGAKGVQGVFTVN